MNAIDLREAAETYVATKTLAPRSRCWVTAIATQMGEFLGHPPTTADLNVETVRAWLEYRSHRVGELAVKSSARRCVTLWRWCADRGWATPCDATPKQLYPEELRRYRPEGPPTPRPKRPRVKAGSPHRKAPPRPDRGVVRRVWDWMKPTS